MKLSGSIEVDDRCKRFRISIEEEFDRLFVVFVRIIVAQFQDVVVLLAETQPAQPGTRKAIEGPPRYDVTLSADVDDGVDRRGSLQKQDLRVDWKRRVSRSSSRRKRIRDAAAAKWPTADLAESPVDRTFFVYKMAIAIRT